MSLAAYTPFQQSILAVVETTENACAFIEQDQKTFIRNLKNEYKARRLCETVWPVVSQHLEKELTRMRSLAKQFAPFPHATPEQATEALRLLDPSPPYVKLPAGIEQLILDYTCEQLGDLTEAMFDVLTEVNDLQPFGKTSKEILSKTLGNELYENCKAYVAWRLDSLVSSIFPPKDARTSSLDAIKLNMLLANLRIYNESFKPSSVKIEEITPDG